MRNQFDEKLELLKCRLMEMGGMIEEMIELTCQALIKCNAEKARLAMEIEDKVDAEEKEIESICLKLLLHQQPIAGDLRRISAALKMTTDLERIGDQANDIAHIVTHLKNPAELPQQTPQLASATIKMVTDSINAFVNKDEKLANAVIAADDAVDKLFWELKSDLIKIIRQGNGEAALDWLMIGKHFERIGDHAVNIAEWVLFSITGVHKNARII